MTPLLTKILAGQIVPVDAVVSTHMLNNNNHFLNNYWFESNET